MAAELPLLVIAELLGVPQEDRRMVFDWSNQMIGSEDPEYQIPDAEPGEAAMQVYAYAEELANNRRREPRSDLISVLIDAEVEGEKLDQFELDLFFLLLIVAGNETTRNLMSGAMTAFFEHPDQWEKLRQDRSLLPNAVEEMLRYVTPVMHFRRTATSDMEIRGQQVREGDKIVFWQRRPTATSWSSTTRTRSTSPGRPTPTSRSAAAAPTSAWEQIWLEWRSWCCSTASSTGFPISG